MPADFALPPDKRYHGNYGGLVVQVGPNRVGTLVLASEDSRSLALGFDNVGRDEYVKVVPLDDPALRYWEVPRGTPKPPRPDRPAPEMPRDTKSERALKRKRR